MIHRISVLVTVTLFALIFIRLTGGYTEQSTLRPLAEHYVSQAPLELGVSNIVTGILIAYRGFDTLGEVAVLFMVAASVGLLLRKDEAAPTETVERRRRPASEIVITGSRVLLPVILTFGAYVIVNGHLSAGGGFQGGAIVASGVMLLLLADPGARINAAALSMIESLAGMLYVGMGILGLILAGGFLDPRFLPPGETGAFISAGAIPLISALLGIKVGAEHRVINNRFRS
jgi:multicomponent Na+:H+ antiporter subunit B